MLFVMYGVVIFIPLVAVAVAAMKDIRLANATSNRKSG
jgi:hypothetical protein